MQANSAGCEQYIRSPGVLPWRVRVCHSASLSWPPAPWSSCAAKMLRPPALSSGRSHCPHSSGCAGTQRPCSHGSKDLCSCEDVEGGGLSCAWRTHRMNTSTSPQAAVSNAKSSYLATHCLFHRLPMVPRPVLPGSSISTCTIPSFCCALPGAVYTPL